MSTAQINNTQGNEKVMFPRHCPVLTCSMMLLYRLHDIDMGNTQPCPQANFQHSMLHAEKREGLVHKVT